MNRNGPRQESWGVYCVFRPAPTRVPACRLDAASRVPVCIYFFADDLSPKCNVALRQARILGGGRGNAGNFVSAATASARLTDRQTMLLYYLRNHFKRHLRTRDFPAIVSVLTFQYRKDNCDEEND